MRQKPILIIALIALTILVSSVTAQNMTVTNFGITGKQDLMIYGSDGALLGLYNTSSPIIPLPDEDFHMVIRPNTVSSYLSNPLLLFTDTIALIIANWPAMFLIIGLVLLVFTVARLGRK